MIDTEQYKNSFATYLFRLGYAESTIKHSKSSLERFLTHLKSQHIQSLNQVQPENLIAYNAYLHSLKSRITKLGLNSKTIQQNINVVKQFSQYLEQTEQLKIYTIKLETEPSIKNHRNILTQNQIQDLYNACDNTIIGLRNKTILGLYYGCGLRYSEGIKLEIKDIDYKKQLLYIAPGKNYKSRFVPINNQVLKDFLDYERYSRNSPLNPPKGDLFLSGAKSNSSLNKVLENLCNKAGIEKRLCLHSLRHSIATHLLQKEMPLEQIAKFLGHTTLRATEIYTRIVNELWMKI